MGPLVRHLFLLVALLTPSTTALANDSSFGGEGADLAPLRETRVRMVSEDIVITGSRRRDFWRVEARYVFENPTDDEVALQVGFPERHCTAELGDCESSGEFHDLRTEVRGRRVESRVGRVGQSPSWAPDVGRVYLFDVRWAPRETVEVVHRYRLSWSHTIGDGEAVYYVTRTGALWNGPIGHARFTIRTPFKPWRLSYPIGYDLARYTETPTRRGALTEIVFEMRDWTPSADLSVFLAGSMDLSQSGGLRDCASPGYLAERFERGERPAEIIADVFPDADDEALRRCRNMPYAAHGRRFRDEELNRHFYRPDVLSPDPSGWLTADQAREEGREPEVFTLVGFRPNPAYVPSLLSAVERLYIRRIGAELARRRASR